MPQAGQVKKRTHAFAGIGSAVRAAHAGQEMTALGTGFAVARR